MIIEPRAVGFKTILDTARMRPQLFQLNVSAIIFVLAGIILTLIFSQFVGDTLPVDFDQVMKEGISATGTITDIETQTNVSINNEHPSIISYKYAVNGRDVEAKFKALDPHKVDALSVGDQIEYGKVTAAEILSVMREQFSARTIFSRSRSLSTVHYQYKDVMGKMHQGEAKTNDQAFLNTIKTGDTIKIFVSPDDESKSTLIPRLAIARNNWKID